MQSKTVNNEYSHDRQPWLAYIQSGPLHGGSAFDIKMIITKPETLHEWKRNSLVVDHCAGGISPP